MFKNKQQKEQTNRKQLRIIEVITQKKINKKKQKQGPSVFVLKNCPVSGPVNDATSQAEVVTQKEIMLHQSDLMH